ncbi:hypothetical protein LI291_10830 [Intestinibacillus massiliensis]|uniref:hypothetical protein n=1 Tax=Intestinibacillus massiliensis TaxID=1871029 RepID=UPI000B36189E|nr:hypothetical protein [Intestinibacillus massiliensis]MCB6366667.1 hypothetical protein [Intestinibacillus massiliensis]
MENYYIGHIAEITKIANENGKDWGVAVSMFDAKYGTPEGCEEQRRAFFDYVRGKAFHEDGTLRGYVWKDGSVHDEPEQKHK